MKKTITHQGRRYVIVAMPTLAGDLGAVAVEDGVVVVLDMGSPKANVALARRLIDRALRT